MLVRDMKINLADLQTLVVKGIKDRDDAALDLVRKPPNDSVEVMFGVYRNAYILRLTEFLTNDHPRLRAYLGDDAFIDMSKAYAAAHPSDNPNARWYSRHVPEFLGKQTPWSGHPEIAELAEIERALTDSFDSTDAPIFKTEALQTLDPERFDEARLTFHPSLRRLALSTNAAAIWTGLKDGGQPPPAERLTETSTLLVWRQGGGSRLRTLEKEEAMALTSAIEAVPFGVLCEMVAVMDDPETAAIRAATYLRQWIESEIVSDIRTD